MDSALNLILLIEVLFVLNLGLSTNQKGICSKTVLGEPKCCANYRKVGMKCEECWPGTYGENCQQDCPYGRYGRFCIMICQCEACNKVTGCAKNTSSDIEGFQVFSTRDFKDNMGSVSDPSSKMSSFRLTGVKKLESNEGISSTYVHKKNISDEPFWTVTRRGSIKDHSYDITTRTVSNIKEDNISVTNANPKTVKGNGLEWWIIFVAFGFILLGIAFGYICSKKCTKVHQPAVYFHSEISNDRNNLEQEAYSVLRKDRKREQSINEQKSSTSSTLQDYFEIDDFIEEFSPSIDSH
ncbi:uncharacterized protein LOC134244228 [Saccostrea cucullata]|uniref:uncharacterized protein LOC134244228 n=1 Tax=Saccostrea cuccullata TaxID=36930 RepID=UPI002ED18549